MKKVARIFSRIISVVLVFGLLFSAYVFVVTLAAGKDKVPSVFGFSFLRVVTGSMEPTIPTGSVVIMRKADASAVRVGDIICFYSSDPSIKGKPNTHRVVGIDTQNGVYVFTTQGDASDTPDPYPVYEGNLVGVYVRYLQIGKAMDLLHNQYFFVFGLLVPLIAVIFIEFVRVKRAAILKGDDDAPSA